MHDLLRILAPVVLCTQAVAVYWMESRETPPAAPDLSHFPSRIGRWEMQREDPLDPEIVNKLRADQLVSRIYVPSLGGPAASLFIGWFQSQQGGDRQPHSPQVCLPGSGWTPESTGDITIQTGTDSIEVKRYVIASRRDRAVVLYWYQTPHRVIAGEWAAKLWVLADGIRYHRSDTAQIRIVVWSTTIGDAAATELASSFARSLYPVLRRELPQ